MITIWLFMDYSLDNWHCLKSTKLSNVLAFYLTFNSWHSFRLLLLFDGFCFRRLFLLPLWCQDQFGQRSPEIPWSKEEEDSEVSVGHHWNVFLRLEERERKEAVRQEEEVVDLSADPSGKVEGRVLGEQGLQPRAVVQHSEELENGNLNELKILLLTVQVIT